MIAIFLIGFIVSFLRCWWLLDPDFGWHLRTGQLIMSLGIPRNDPFSFTMPSFPYVDHAWLTDWLTAVIFSHLGYLGLALIWAGIVTLFFFLAARCFGWIKPILILVWANWLTFLAVRPQVVSWCLFALVFWLITDSRRWSKFRYGLPFLFLLWSNLHGGFALGLLVIFVFIFSQTWSARRINPVDWLILGLSFLVTFINPYGVGLWREILSTVSDSNLRFAVAEWLPVPLWFEPGAVILLTTACVILWRYRKLWPGPITAVYILTALYSLTAIKNLPFLVVASATIIFIGTNYFLEEAKHKSSLWRWRRVESYLLVFTGVVFLANTFISLRSAGLLSEEHFYPRHAISFLRARGIGGRIFSSYGWGGYLIGELPGSSVFVDGRMPSWRLAPAAPSESTDAFSEYEKITNGKEDLDFAFEKYQVSLVIWPTQDTFNIGKKLAKKGWQKVFQDKIAVVYKKS